MDDGIRPMTRMLLAVALLAVAALALMDAGTPAPAGAEPVGRAPGLHSMRSCPHLRSSLRRQGATPPRIAIGWGVEGDAAAGAEGAPASSAPAGSPTNVQETGVDEPDVVKVA